MNRTRAGHRNRTLAAMLGVGLLLLNNAARGNGLTVSNVTLLPSSATESFIQFDLSWNNSWRTAVKGDTVAVENWDAAWVFVKHHPIKDDAPWRHAALAKDGHQAPAGATLSVGTSEANGTAFGAGVFIYRSAASETGPNDWKSVKLRWQHEAGTVNTNTVLEVQAMEMVYVPQGAFWAGDGQANRGRFTKTQITQADPTKDGGRPAGTLAPENGNTLWPNGFNGFYCMKYELTHRDYLTFLKAHRAATFDYTPYPVRKDIAEPTNPQAPRSWLSWGDGASFAAWAGLRPMTELEFEKACRGPVAPVAGEFAWGTANKLAAPVAAAAASNLVANLAPNSGVSREQTGASYWGILNLSGSLWDRVVTIDNSTGYPTDKGRQFRGTHGIGTAALPADWPDKEGNGAGLRGGAAGLALAHMGVSDRYSAAYVNNSRGARNGFRAVRTAP
jgi:hypothetical protein